MNARGFIGPPVRFSLPVDCFAGMQSNETHSPCLFVYVRNCWDTNSTRWTW